MNVEQEKMIPEGRAKIEYGGWKELKRKLKRLHAMAMPTIYYVSGGMFFLAGLLLYIQLQELLSEKSTADAKVIPIIFAIVLFYWTIRIMFHRRMK